MQSVATTARAPRVARTWSVLGPAERSLFEALVPSATVVHKIAAALAFIALTALLAKTRFYLPDNPVPVNLQTFGVLLTGGVLGWRWGLGSIVGYYLVGMAGVPVFTNDGGGWEYVTTSVTGGYLLGFIVAAGLAGFLSQRGWNRGRGLWAMLLGSLAVYVPGLIWLSVFDLGWPAEGELFSAALYPFIPGDLVKLMLAALVTGGLWRYVDRRDTNTRP